MFSHPQAITAQLCLSYIWPASTKAMEGGGSSPTFTAGQGARTAVLCGGRLLPSKLKELETIAYKPVISNDKSAMNM